MKHRGNPFGDQPVLVHGPLPRLFKFWGFWYCEVPGLLAGRGHSYKEAWEDFLLSNFLDRRAQFLGGV